MNVDIYTDGSCLKNPGPGGYAAVGPGWEIVGGAAHTTNNAMEMTAVCVALERAAELCMDEVTIWTDSQYVKNGITSWIDGWKRKGWKTSTGAPVKNKELWMRMDALRARLRVNFKWVKAHNGHPLNERADTLARDRAKLFLNQSQVQ